VNYTVKAQICTVMNIQRGALLMGHIRVIYGVSVSQVTAAISWAWSQNSTIFDALIEENVGPFRAGLPPWRDGTLRSNAAAKVR
jgi:hypothetical protein